jgi:hypothetical protein
MLLKIVHFNNTHALCESPYCRSAVPVRRALLPDGAAVGCALQLWLNSAGELRVGKAARCDYEKCVRKAELLRARRRKNAKDTILDAIH